MRLDSSCERTALSHDTISNVSDYDAALKRRRLPSLEASGMVSGNGYDGAFMKYMSGISTIRMI